MWALWWHFNTCEYCGALISGCFCFRLESNHDNTPTRVHTTGSHYQCFSISTRCVTMTTLRQMWTVHGCIIGCFCFRQVCYHDDAPTGVNTAEMHQRVFLFQTGVLPWRHSDRCEHCCDASPAVSLSDRWVTMTTLRQVWALRGCITGCFSFRQDRDDTSTRVSTIEFNWVFLFQTRVKSWRYSDRCGHWRDPLSRCLCC